MIDRIKKAFEEASDILKEQTSNIGEGAKERTYKLIDEWLQVFPKLEIYGLEITSFSMSVALSPSIEVELVGKHQDFTNERLQKIIQDNRKSPALTSVFTTIKTAYTFHRKTLASLRDPLIVKIRLKLSPEIKVFIGNPVIQ